MIDAFLEGVRAKQIGRSETALAQLEQLAARQAALRPWCLYLAGILANERDHDPADGERLFRAVLDSQPPPQPDLAARLQLALGMTYWRQGRWLDALSACERASETYATLDDRVGQAKALKLLVIVRCEGFDRGDLGPATLQMALEECRQGLSLLQPVAKSTAEARWLLGTLWNELGAVHRTLGQWQDAIACYQRYREIAQALDHRFGVGLATTNMAESYARQGPEHWASALNLVCRRSADLARGRPSPARDRSAFGPGLSAAHDGRPCAGRGALRRGDRQPGRAAGWHQLRSGPRRLLEHGRRGLCPCPA